ncbi:class I SAM-dependent methyltransferase [Actinomadura vinacea]|uniref:class I SAM-dependent methyltransferase n=1 Tax=Actinomadura vinacea TaxID=115336 RepID=UPI0031D380FF
MDTIELQRIVEVEDDNWWYLERRAILARELCRAAAAGAGAPGRAGIPGRAVDIGAAGGGNTRVLKDHGWRAIAIDNSPTAVDLCLAQGINACHGDACFLPLPSGELDLALALNVLEHVEDDRAAAAEMARVLRPGGAALVAVPCDMALWSAYDVALGRVRRYSRRALTDLLEEAGLVVDALWGWNVLLRPLVRLLRHRSPHCEDLAHLHPLLNEALHLVTVMERYLPLKSRPGVTLFARARRPGASAS